MLLREGNVVAPEGTYVQTPALFPGMRCYSRLNAIEGCEKSPGDCWEACRNQYGDRIVAIDWNEDDGKCHCQDACDCLVSTAAPTNCQSGYDADGYHPTPLHWGLRLQRVGWLLH